MMSTGSADVTAMKAEREVHKPFRSPDSLPKIDYRLNTPQAAEARVSLKVDRELVRTVERLTVLEGKGRFALATVSSRNEEAHKLVEYLEDVNSTKAKFEPTLWGHIASFFHLAKEAPQNIVRALPVVEMQEIQEPD
ncbi:hypothetical protein R1flu_009787 [Riccia fluitans]|uniref:Uncharacterized protein n=1 Tax=Riccia fluitans TaxID=41844 RepID=A0ABD1Z3W5_9MARC